MGIDVEQIVNKIFKKYCTDETSTDETSTDKCEVVLNSINSFITKFEKKVDNHYKISNGIKRVNELRSPDVRKSTVTDTAVRQLSTTQSTPSASENSVERATSNIIPLPSTTCPIRLLDEKQYKYNEYDWGGLGKSDGELKTGMKNAACVWAGVCKGDVKCLARCPVAMGIGGMESNFNPATFAQDGGYGLWQIGGPNAPVTAEGFKPCDSGDDPGNPVKCSAYNPITLGKWVRSKTNNGSNWNPPGRCWTTCTGKACNPNGDSSWETGWTTKWANKQFDGAKAYATSRAVDETCKEVIESVYPNLKGQITWESPDKCMLDNGYSGNKISTNQNSRGNMRCGLTWTDANMKSNNIACPNGNNSPCPSGQKCYNNVK